jgi:hypothetical protein
VAAQLAASQEGLSSMELVGVKSCGFPGCESSCEYSDLLGYFYLFADAVHAVA